VLILCIPDSSYRLSGVGVFDSVLSAIYRNAASTFVRRTRGKINAHGQHRGMLNAAARQPFVDTCEKQRGL
jgi:hypothetical protein